MDFSQGYAVVDLETTGLDCWTDLIIEIGVTTCLPNEDLKTDSVLVRIDRPLPGKIVELTGITDHDLTSRGVPIDDALAWFVERTGDLPIIGHNIIEFDRAFLLEAARVHRRSVEGGRYPQRVIDEVDHLPIRRFIDTMALYKGLKLGNYPNPGEQHHEYVHRVLNLRVPGLRYNLAAACENFRIPPAECAPTGPTATWY